MFLGTGRISIRKRVGPELQPVVHDLKAENLPLKRAGPTWGTGLGEQRLVEGPWASLLAS